MRIVAKFPFVESESKILRKRVEELEKRNLERPPKWLDDLLSGTETSSGVYVNEESSLAFTAVWSAVKLLSESIAQLPLQVYKRTGSGKELYKVHPTYTLVHENPNEWMSKFTFVQTLMSWVLLWGNGYAKIIKNGKQRPIGLEILPASMVTPDIIEGKLFYRYNTEVFAPYELLHVMGFSLNGYEGKSPIQVAKDSVGLGLAAQKFGSHFFANGANTSTALQVPTNLTDEQYKRLQSALMSRASGLDNAHKPMILEGGMTLTALTIPPDSAQFIQTRNFQVDEVARIFNVPPHMIGNLERSTNNNIEQQSLEFVKYSLMPWIIRLEEELTRKLIWEAEKPDVFIEANVEGLLRGDVQARAAFYQTLWQIGAVSANEIRSKENMNPYEGGDEYMVPVNYQTVKNAQSNTVGDPGGPDATGDDTDGKDNSDKSGDMDEGSGQKVAKG